ncbi:MAG: heme-binding Shp domain-containing protein [Tissierellia bacterium]|nr:heme-binding Shp domain-containing protein [Tissierellia bacterium]
MKRIFNIIIVLILLFPIQIFAYTQEIAKATPYYSHPVTGIIEDPGNNPGIGQGMTENVLHPQALVEEVEGRYFLTVRYNLANYIKNESFAVQNRGDEAFYSVGAEVTASTAETKDYRFEIPSKNVVIRSTFFVGPMGRDVIFYYDLSNFTPGNTDFVTLQNGSGAGQSQENEQPTTSTPSGGSTTSTPGPNPTLSPSTPSPTSNSLSPSSSPVSGTPLPQGGVGEKIETQAVNTKMEAGDLGYKHGLLMSTSPIIQKIYGEGEDIKTEEEETIEEKAPMGPITKAILYMFFGILGILTTLLILLATGIFLYTEKISRENDRLREELYEEI